MGPHRGGSKLKKIWQLNETDDMFTTCSQQTLGIQIIFGHAMPHFRPNTPLLLAFSALAAMRTRWDGVVEAPWMQLQVPGA
jgi:hypothetical protein